MPKTLSRPAQAGTSPSTTSYFELMVQKAPKNGWVFVYLSNESNQTVFFDNFQVGHNRGRIIEEVTNHKMFHSLQPTST